MTGSPTTLHGVVTGHASEKSLSDVPSDETIVDTR